MATQGKRVGSRRGPKRQSSFQPSLLGLAIGVTLAVVAWGYLVYAAIDFGSTARDGGAHAWWFLAVASLGAVACLFVGLMLIARLLRRLGITSERTPAAVAEAPDAREAPETPEPPRQVGGHRA